MRKNSLYTAEKVEFMQKQLIIDSHLKKKITSNNLTIFQSYKGFSRKKLSFNRQKIPIFKKKFYNVACMTLPIDRI